MKVVEFPTNRKFGMPDGSPKNIEAWVSGGSILSTLRNVEPADYDLYPKTSKDAIELLAYLTDDCGGFVLDVTERAITVKTNTTVQYFDQTNRKTTGNRAIYQIIYFKEWKSLEDLFDTFDFSACMIAYDLKSEKTFCSESFIRTMTSNAMEFSEKTAFPIASLTRIPKYEKKGFRFPKRELMRMGLTIASTSPPSSWDDINSALGGYYGKQLKLLVPSDLPFSIDNALNMLSSAEMGVFDLNNMSWPKYDDNATLVYDAVLKQQPIVKIMVEGVPICIVPGNESIPGGCLWTKEKFGDEVLIADLPNVADKSSYDAISMLSGNVVICVHGDDARNPNVELGFDSSNDTVNFEVSALSNMTKPYRKRGAGFDDLIIKMSEESGEYLLKHWAYWSVGRSNWLKGPDDAPEAPPLLTGEVMAIRASSDNVDDRYFYPLVQYLLDCL